MPGVIEEERPRVRFKACRFGTLQSLDTNTYSQQLLRLSRLMSKMEALGAAPVMFDGLVGGNCGIRLPASSDALRPDIMQQGAEQQKGSILVSRSGKPPGHSLQPSEFVQLLSFDKTEWAAQYTSTDEHHRPTSDSPLLYSCLSPEAATRYGWTDCPAVALHGHALAAGKGLQQAEKLQLPISDQETLCSTPEDLTALETLFIENAYPQHKCFIRRGHGFFIVGRDIADVEDTFTRLVEPYVNLEVVESSCAHNEAKVDASDPGAVHISGGN